MQGRLMWPEYSDSGVGIATFAGDVLKTVVAMLLGEYLGGEIGKVLSAAACIIGHSWPFITDLKGEKACRWARRLRLCSTGVCLW